MVHPFGLAVDGNPPPAVRSDLLLKPFVVRECQSRRTSGRDGKATILKSVAVVRTGGNTPNDVVGHTPGIGHMSAPGAFTAEYSSRATCGGATSGRSPSCLARVTATSRSCALSFPYAFSDRKSTRLNSSHLGISYAV